MNASHVIIMLWGLDALNRGKGFPKTTDHRSHNNLNGVVNATAIVFVDHDVSTAHTIQHYIHNPAQTCSTCRWQSGVACFFLFWVNTKNNTIMCVARASNSKRDCEHDLYCCLLPRCEALRTCRSRFPIATLSLKLRKPNCLIHGQWENKFFLQRLGTVPPH